jgi:predicted MFS family arabinose efflux permease
VVIALGMIAVKDSPWLLILLTLLSGVGKAFFETARITAIPQIVGGHSIPTAVALFQSTNHTLNLIGPAIGGVLLAIGNVTVVFAIDAATFALSALLLGSMAVLREVPQRNVAGGGEPYLKALRTGVSGVLKVPSLRMLSVFLMPLMLVLGLFTTNINTQLLNVFKLPAFDYGLAQAFFGGGAILGALIGPALVRRYSDHGLLVGSTLVFGLSLVLLVPTDAVRGTLGFAVVATWCLLSGLGSGLFQVPMANTVLRDLPEELRGRGVGLFNSLMINFMVAGVLLGGLLAGLLGTAGSIIVAGAALVVVGGALTVPALRPVAAAAPEAAESRTS